MPRENTGWEFHIVRKSEQRRSSDGKRRTVGTYQIFHNGVRQTGSGLSGTVAETRGPGANRPVGNNRRVEQGRYPLFTQGGTKYVTIGYRDSESPSARPKPGLELKNTDQRSEILSTPARVFSRVSAASIPARLCQTLPN